MQNHQVVEELEEVVVVGEVEEVDDLLVGEGLGEEVVLEVVVEDLEEVDVGVVEDLEVEEMVGFLKDGVAMIEWAMMKAMAEHMVEEEEEVVVVQGEVHHHVDNHVEDMVMLMLEGEVAMEIVVMIDMLMAMGVIMVMITMEKVVEEVVVVMEVVEVEVVVVDHIVISTITYKMW